MALNVEMITFDCVQPDSLAEWWAKAAGGDVNAVAPGEFVMVVQEGRPTLGFQRVPDPTPARTRSIWTSTPPTKRPRWPG